MSVARKQCVTEPSFGRRPALTPRLIVLFHMRSEPFR